VFALTHYVRGHGFWFAAACGALAGLVVALMYNALARFFRWQTLHLADILWVDVPF